MTGSGFTHAFRTFFISIQCALKIDGKGHTQFYNIKCLLSSNTICKLTENTRFQAHVAMDIFEQLQSAMQTG